ncbi:MAG: ATP-binding protein [Bacteroidia bacterium]
MKYYIFILSVLILGCCRLSAQKTDFAPVFTVTADTATIVQIPERNWQYSVEKEPMPFKVVSSEAFSKNFKQGKVLSTKVSNFWVRYKIKNTLNYPLRFTTHTEKEGHVYFIHKGTVKHYLSGYLVPKSKREGLKKLLAIAYTLPAGEEVTLYVHAVGYDMEGIYPFIGIWDKVVQAYYIDSEEPLSDISIFLGGFIFFAALFNFLFYYIVRERVYLVYALTLFVISMAFADSMLFQALFDEVPLSGHILRYFIYVLGMVLALTVMAMFLQIDRYYPRLFRIFIIVTIIGGILGYMAYNKNIFHLWNNMALIANLTCTIPVGFIITTTVIQVIKKRKAAYLFSIALFPMMISMFVALLLPRSPDWLVYIQELSSMWGIAVLSWSLFQRFRKIMHDNVQQALDNEKLAREKEEERNELIARQNELLEQQVAERTTELQKSLEDLKLTQNQLIQSEKMASLGELTAGIAHEIQNPLNFVNNFSDVSVELIDEMEEELNTGDIEEVKAIAGDIKQNLEKIAHHGRRADSIVKGMLQHSRASTGQKELTDINALADEYLRLAYHGLRAKDKSFNAELITHFDSDLPKVSVVAQDMGRVLLNLFTNAFYATQQKVKSPPAPKGGETVPYNPSVSVTTKRVGDTVEIIVRDNGAGIPDAIKDKILQPFFTTKPTGEGTGLGLSMSYDIVVKGHGGSINIESREGEYTEFTVRIK